MDKFPEAFDRFEEFKGESEMRKIKSFNQLYLQFMLWGKERWIDSQKQLSALKHEAQERKIGYLQKTTNRLGFVYCYNVATGRFVSRKEYNEYFEG